MKKNRLFKVLSVVMSILVFISVLPATVLSVDAAEYEEIYVLDSVERKSQFFNDKYQFSYNNDGLVNKQVLKTSIKINNSTEKRKYVYDYTYKGGLIKSYIFTSNESGSKEKAKATFSYNSDNNIKKIVFKVKKGSKENNHTQQYSYDKNKRLKKIITKYPELNNTFTNTFSYNKKNQIIKEIYKASGSYTYKSTSTNKYDKNGYIISTKITDKRDGKSYTSTRKQKIKYNDRGQFKKVVVTQTHTVKTTYTYKYKKIKINKKYKKQIENQQNKDFLIY